MENKSAAERLRAIREAANLSPQVVADRMDMKLSSYRHYEERYKRDSLPANFVVKLLAALRDFPELENDIRALIKLPSQDRHALSEPSTNTQGQPLAGKLSPDKRPTPEITIKVDGTIIQVYATIDRYGIDKLIEKLEIARELLD